MQPPIIHLRTADAKEEAFGRPRVVRGAINALVATAPMAGGGSASVDTGASPSGVPTTGYTLTAGASTGYAGGRARALFTGNGSGADGYFVIASNGTLSSLVITSVGSGYTGVVTATPAACPLESVVFDLGTDWHQYTMGQIAFLNLPQNDSVLRASVSAGREAAANDFMCVGLSRTTGAPSDAWFSPMGGGSPTGLIRLGARYVRVDVVMGISTGATFALNLIAFPN